MTLYEMMLAGVKAERKFQHPETLKPLAHFSLKLQFSALT